MPSCACMLLFVLRVMSMLASFAIAALACVIVTKRALPALAANHICTALKLILQQLLLPVRCPYKINNWDLKLRMRGLVFFVLLTEASLVQAEPRRPVLDHRSGLVVALKAFNENATAHPQRAEKPLLPLHNSRAVIIIGGQQDNDSDLGGRHCAVNKSGWEGLSPSGSFHLDPSCALPPLTREELHENHGLDVYYKPAGERLEGSRADEAMLDLHLVEARPRGLRRLVLRLRPRRVLSVPAPAIMGSISSSSQLDAVRACSSAANRAGIPAAPPHPYTAHTSHT